ncbi:MAG: hypothetical protein MJ154_02220 [Candidatus Saccharibacteria bacterium]|nr:hypothetical protein [Candidatus Saccharibacteria bacterium]
MARGGDYYDESGDFDSGDFDDSREYGDDSSRYGDMWQDALNRKSTVNGRPIDEEEGGKRRSLLGKKNEDDGGGKGGYGKFGKKQDEDGNSKWGLLKKGEKDASKKPNEKGKGGDKKASLGEKENNVESDGNGDGSTQDKFKNAVKGAQALKSGNVIKAGKKFKKAGPIITILACCLTFGGGAFMGQMAMPFSLVSQFQEQFDSIGTSQNMRARKFQHWQTTSDSGLVRDCRKAHYFKADEFKVTSRMENKLGARNITFEEEDGITVMKFKRANGEVSTIVADKSQANDERMFFEDAFNKDSEFRQKYTDGAKTWRGSVAAWYDSSMTKLLAKMGIKRGIWRDFMSGKTNGEGMEDMRNTIAGDADSDGVNGKTRTGDIGDSEELDAEGNPKKALTGATDADDAGISRADIETDANGKVTGTDGLKSKLSGIGKKLGKIKGVAEAAIGVYCGIADFVGAVNAIVAAYQTLQIVSLTANFFEGIQKAQAGDGDAAPLHELMTSLTQPTESTYTEVKSVKDLGNDNFEPDQVDTTTRSRSAMEANAIGATYGNTTVDPTDPSVKSYNTNSFTKNLYSGLASILNHVDVSASAFRSCTVARMAAATVDVTVDVISIVACAASVGIGCIVDFFVDQAASVAFNAAFSTAVAVAVSYMVPFIANILTRKIATEVLGEDLGNALVSGANQYMGKNHQYSGGSLATKNAFISYSIEHERVVAENARYERETRSPFDITSQYTFLGSIAKQMTPLISSSSSVMGIINGATKVVGTAVSSLVPRSSAVSAGIEAQVAADNTESNCPDLADIKAVGDAFCNPYIITDTSTMNTHPAEIVDSISDGDLIENNGKPEVVENSDLAKYIVYCGQRSSPFGLADQNIAGEVDGGSTGNSVGDAILGAVPIVGDSMDILSAETKLRNFGWISGEACVAGNNIGFDATPKWEESKKYQRFIEDQRLAESEGLIEKSAVTEYLAKYYEKHPVDNSYEGLLARYSGLKKEKVEETLATLEVLQWVAEYNPSEYAPYFKRGDQLKEEENTEIQLEENTIVASVFTMAMRDYSYIDSRRANYAFAA